MDKDKSEREQSDSEGSQDEPMRQGDVLGLGGIAIPRDSTTSSTERTRAHESSGIGDSDEEDNMRDTAFRRSSGATGIDMGAGGSGTDVE